MITSRRLTALATGVSALALAMGLAAPADALVVRDDVGVDGSNDTGSDAQWDGVVQLYLWRPNGGIFFNCTGTLINPRTVISAAHCFNGQPSTDYGAARDGTQTTVIVGYGPDTFDGLFNWLDTGSVQLDERNGVAFSSQVIIHPDADLANGSAVDFPGADVALVSLTSPLANLPTYSLLFSPVPVGTHVTQVAYGGAGTGSLGAVDGIDGKRQAGENIIGLIGSQNDFLRGTFGRPDAGIFGGPGANQSLYYIDFDNPNRTGDECGRDESGNLICDDAVGGIGLFDSVLAPSTTIDYFDGDALPGEAGTAGGDSGSAIFVDELGPTPLIAGVLSGGFNFTTPVSNGYGDISYYNPLFNFYDFISNANPYKYVSAIEGDGNWSDADHWVQRLDPGYFIIDADGNLVNGLPDGPEPGLAGTGPREGSIYDVDINDVFPAETGAEAAPRVVNEEQNSEGVTSAGNGSIQATQATASGLVATTDGAALAVPNTAPIGSVQLPAPQGFIGVAIAEELDGPGSTGFVPDNGFAPNCDAATSLTNCPERFFDVTLSAAGTTTADIDVVIDRLTLDNAGAGLVIAEDTQFISLIDTQIAQGTLDVGGVFASRDILNGGFVTGSGGTIVTDTLFNAGTISAGTGLTVEGDLVLTSLTRIIYEGNAIDVDGDVSLGGGVDGVFGDGGTLLTHTGTRVGTFNGDLAGVLDTTYTYNANSVDFEIVARNFQTEFNGAGTQNARAVGGLLDGLRATDYTGKSDLYAPLDVLSGELLVNNIETLIPTGAIAQQTFGLVGAETRMGQLGARVDAIRAGSADGASYSAAGLTQAGQIGMDMGGLAANAEQIARADTDRTASGWGSFVSASYYEGDQSGLQGANSRDIDGFAITAGIDRDLSEGTRIGAFATYTDTNSDSEGSVTSASSDGFLIGGYGVKQTVQADFSAYAGFGQRNLDTVRAGADFALVNGSTDADEIIAGIAASKMNTFGPRGFGFEPEARLDYVKLDVDGYTETGGVSAVEVGSTDVSSLQASIGADVHFYNTANEATRWRPIVGAKLVQELGGDDATAAISLPGQIGQGTAIVSGGERDDSWFEWQAGLEYAASERASGGLFVETTTGRDDLDYMTVGAKLRVKF